ncbi:MAG TPA: YdjY domain-containing protein [Tepidisphaeraceae bacterium]|nr:YdjY domain-containing protein [Tepidisphaeraceae bacterium]
MPRPRLIAPLLALATLAASVPARATEPATRTSFPHLSIDPVKKQVRVEAEMLGVEAPLEFFACVSGTSEHEAAVRSAVKPSDLHTALLVLGLQPGEPVRYSEAAKKWVPPHGPPLHLSVEWTDKDGRRQRVPAYRLMRDVRTKREMPPMTWIFAGSRVLEDGAYAADSTGYLVSVVNFDLTVIDIPELASSANESLEWALNPDVAPPAGTPVTLVIEPAGAVQAPAAVGTPMPATTRALDPQADRRLSDVSADEAKVRRLGQRWEQVVAPKAAALAEAAQAHYEVINDLRREQQRLIDEADLIQRQIDALEKRYGDMTTPRPEPTS